MFSGRAKSAPEQRDQDFAMAAKGIAVKKNVVKLSEAERGYLQSLINKGKGPAKRPLKARILLKADASERGEGWSDWRIVEALDTNFSMVTGTPAIRGRRLWMTYRMFRTID
ncbi:MAG: hypothetical protein WBX25_10735 [Rhodomicrobium sp.]